MNIVFLLVTVTSHLFKKYLDLYLGDSQIESQILSSSVISLILFFFKAFYFILGYHFSSVQSLSHVQLFATPWTAACQASLSIINSQSLFKLMSFKSVMPSSHLILCRPLLFLPSIFHSIRVFSNESFFASDGQSVGTSASISALPMNILDWFSLGLNGLVFLRSKGLSRVFSNTTVQKHQFFSTQLSL